MLSLEQALKLQVWIVLVEKEDFNVNVVSGGVEKVVEECLDSPVVDVATDDDELSPVHLILSGIPAKSTNPLNHLSNASLSRDRRYDCLY